MKCASTKPNSHLYFQVVIWRAMASIAWSVLLLPVTTAVFVLLSRFSLFHPIQWISGEEKSKKMSFCKLH